MAGPLVATTRIRHNGEWLRAGDEIVNATPQDEMDLVAMGMATRLSGMARALNVALNTERKARPRRAQYERRDVVVMDMKDEKEEEL